MPDFSPYLIAHGETIGDSCTSEEYDSVLHPPSPSDNDESTNIASKTIIYTLEFLLMIVMLPIAAFQRLYENDHLMVMMRVLLEVSLELIMWLILAGVSILASAALIFDDLYCGKSGSEGYRRLVKNCTAEGNGGDDQSQHPLNHSVAENNEDNDSSEENQRPEETVVRLNQANRSRISSTFQSPRDKVQDDDEKFNKVDSYEPEKDDGSVNFSFYKPLRPRFIPEDKKNVGR